MYAIRSYYDHHHDHDHHHHRHADGVTHLDEGFSALRFDLADTVDRDRLFATLAASPPGVFRIKGVARIAGAPLPVVVQYVPGRAEVEPARKPSPAAPFLLIIGRDLDADGLRRQWRPLLKEPCDVLD